MRTHVVWVKAACVTNLMEVFEAMIARAVRVGKAGTAYLEVQRAPDKAS